MRGSRGSPIVVGENPNWWNPLLCSISVVGAVLSVNLGVDLMLVSDSRFCLWIRDV